MRNCVFILCVVIGGLVGVMSAHGQKPLHHSRYVIVKDAVTNHIYTVDHAPEIKVTPIVELGDDLSGLIDQITPSTTQKPWKTENFDKVKQLLLDGKAAYGHDYAMMVDFFKARDASNAALQLHVTFKSPVVVQSVIVQLQKMNQYYQVHKFDVAANDDPAHPVQLNSYRFDDQKCGAYASQGIKTQSLLIKIYGPRKLNLTELTIMGHQPGQEQSSNKIKPMRAQWVDFHGHSLGASTELQFFETQTLTAPSREIGYVGVRFSPIQVAPKRDYREYGFAILPAKPLNAPAGSTPFGMVHHHLEDHHLGNTWIKTLTLSRAYDFKTGKLDANAWKKAIEHRRELGYEELPLLTKGWKTDGATPVSSEQLQALYQQVHQYFQATPDLLHWELGIEENLRYRKHKKDWPYFWENLKRKVQTVRRAAQSVNPKIQLIYQIAELDHWSLEKFLTSGAARDFNILSLHPYAWPDFPTPQKWMPSFIDDAEGMLKKNDLNMSIWFTEIGAPVQANQGGFYGYPVNRRVWGVERDQAAAFLLKCHVLALGDGVKEIFWYNYRDRHEGQSYPENHFGLVDYWGYPKPAYVAYATMTRMLYGLKHSDQNDRNGVHNHVFTNDQARCHVVWVDKKDSPRQVSLSDLIPNASSERIQVFNIMGRRLVPAPKLIQLSTYPVYVRVDG